MMIWELRCRWRRALTRRWNPFPGASGFFHQDSGASGPSITITSQPNPDQSAEFTPQDLAKWETDGVQHELPRYHFEHTRINDRDAVLIWQYKNRAMLLTARIISPDHIVEANCTPGSADEDLYMQACDESVRTIKVAGPPSPPPPRRGWRKSFRTRRPRSISARRAKQSLPLAGPDRVQRGQILVLIRLARRDFNLSRELVKEER